MRITIAPAAARRSPARPTPRDEAGRARLVDLETTSVDGHAKGVALLGGLVAVVVALPALMTVLVLRIRRFPIVVPVRPRGVDRESLDDDGPGAGGRLADLDALRRVGGCARDVDRAAWIDQHHVEIVRRITGPGCKPRGLEHGLGRAGGDGHFV